MATFTIPAPMPLDMDSGNMAESWRRFAQRFDNFETATGVNAKPEATRVATLLLVIGQRALETYNTFTWDAETDKTKIGPVLAQLKKFCDGKRNITYERHIFNCRIQKEGEKFDSFVTSLKSLAETCEFGTLKDSLILDRIVIGINKPSLKQCLLRTENLTLDTAISKIRAETAASEQMEQMKQSKASDVSDATQHARTVRSHKKGKQKYQNTPQESNPRKSRTSSTICTYCGGEYPHKSKNTCPAYGKKCNNCGKMNHYAKQCRQKHNAHAVDIMSNDENDSTTSEDEYSFHITGTESEKQPKVNLTIQGSTVNAIIDTGATINIMSMSTYKRLQHKPQLYTEKLPKVFGYGSRQALCLAGTFSANITYKTKSKYQHHSA
ncbi:uncharacterized protein [Antedon mediterranea]|uniref:uncharacterized protein n=1 Tax=Antedon mediterranea TaxID=105859 RepID=UPI003AF4263E